MLLGRPSLEQSLFGNGAGILAKSSDKCSRMPTAKLAAAKDKSSILLTQLVLSWPQRNAWVAISRPLQFGESINEQGPIRASAERIVLCTLWLMTLIRPKAIVNRLWIQTS